MPADAAEARRAGGRGKGAAGAASRQELYPNLRCGAPRSFSFGRFSFYQKLPLLEFVSISAEFLRFILWFRNCFYDKQNVGCWKASVSEQMKTHFGIYREAGVAGC